MQQNAVLVQLCVQQIQCLCTRIQCLYSKHSACVVEYSACVAEYSACAAECNACAAECSVPLNGVISSLRAFRPVDRQILRVVCVSARAPLGYWVGLP